MEDTVSGDVKRSTYTVKELLELRGRELDVEITIPSTVQVSRLQIFVYSADFNPRAIV